MARPSKVPKPLQPMLATLIDAPFDGHDWVFESKWDGFRLIAKIEKHHVTLYSRSGVLTQHEEGFFLSAHRSERRHLQEYSDGDRPTRQLSATRPFIARLQR